MKETIKIQLTDDQTNALLEALIKIGFEPVSDNLILNTGSNEDTEKGN